MTLATTLRNAFTGPAEMSEGEALSRAREAYIDEVRPWRWIARRIRAGKCDDRLRATVRALRLAHMPMAMIEAERDEAAVALILRTAPGLDALAYEDRRAVAAAIATGVRMGRRG